MSDATSEPCFLQGRERRPFSFTIESRPCPTVQVFCSSEPEGLHITVVLTAQEPITTLDRAFILKELRSIQREYPTEFTLA